MPIPVEIFFDFSSPYAHIASEKIGDLAARYGHLESWRPFLRGVAFKATGRAPFPSIPIKSQYALRDYERSARFDGLGHQHSGTFPISSVKPARAFYWLDARDHHAAIKPAKAFFCAYFLESSNLEQAVLICGDCGLDPKAASAGIDEAATKERTRKEVEAGLAKGVFGSPYTIVDGEPFWAADRLEQVERWLASCGFWVRPG